VLENIADNGIAIPPEHRERVFRMFERLEGGESDGTGIGLAIRAKGAERMHARIGLESSVGQGSTFWIDLPAPEKSRRAQVST
jgi:signal transduction histidine kinase